MEYVADYQGRGGQVPDVGEVGGSGENGNGKFALARMPDLNDLHEIVESKWQDHGSTRR
jgi:hypothetical protein